jgi:hypothetical protein
MKVFKEFIYGTVPFRLPSAHDDKVTISVLAVLHGGATLRADPGFKKGRAAWRNTQ